MTRRFSFALDAVFAVAVAVLAAGETRADPVPPRSPIVISLAPGSAAEPSAVFPLKPQLDPMPFAWTPEGFLAGGSVVP